jgi:ATP-dependent DNA helicase RecQ
VFTEFRPIDVQEIAQLSGCSDETVRQQLKTLWRGQIIRYVPRSFTPLLTLGFDRVPERDVFINPQSYWARRECATERLAAMCSYAWAEEGCRSRIIQEYFGQTDAHDCDCCDLCIARRKGGDGGGKKSAKGEGVAQPTAERVLELLAEGGAKTMAQLVANFTCSPDEVVEIVEGLIAEGKICADQRGKLRKK